MHLFSNRLNALGHQHSRVSSETNKGYNFYICHATQKIKLFQLTYLQLCIPILLAFWLFLLVVRQPLIWLWKGSNYPSQSCNGIHGSKDVNKKKQLCSPKEAPTEPTDADTGRSGRTLWHRGKIFQLKTDRFSTGAARAPAIGMK